MKERITLFTGQWADLPLTEVCRLAADMGYDGLELCTWGDHFEVDKALSDDTYVDRIRELLASHGLGCWAISPHLIGQTICDSPIDERHRRILPSRVWGDGDPEGVRQRAQQEMLHTIEAAKRFGVDTLVGLIGGSTWYMVTQFPPVDAEMLEQGWVDFDERWTPIFDECGRHGIRYALEVHPTGVAYDYWTTKRTLEKVGHRPELGLNFDPSHFVWQAIDPEMFLRDFSDRIYHVDCKDAIRHLDGRNGLMASHLPFGDLRRGWDFVSVGRGELDWDRIFRTLRQIGYDGPISVEWEDAGMDRERGAAEALQIIRALQFDPPATSFDASFASE